MTKGRPRDGKGPTPRECHEMSCSPCAGVIVCGRSRHRALARGKSSGYVLRFPRLRIFGMGLSFRALFVPFFPPPGCLGSGTLIRAYPARAPAPAGARIAAARFARLIAPARARAKPKGRTQDAPVPPPSQTFFRAAANGCGLRMPLPPDLYRQGGPLVNALQGIFTKIKNKTVRPISHDREPGCAGACCGPWGRGGRR